MAEINGINLPFLPVGGVESLKKTQLPFKEAGKKSFDEVLNEEITRVKFSQHAKSRIESRNLDLSTEDLSKLDEALDKASEKGAKDTMIFLRDMAFIVNVKNRTIVTALDSRQIQENVFTNIDSVLIAK
jgi:flagellar operon protein